LIRGTAHEGEIRIGERTNLSAAASISVTSEVEPDATAASERGDNDDR
jgi:hypothetical protein